MACESEVCTSRPMFAGIGRCLTTLNPYGEPPVRLLLHYHRLILMVPGLGIESDWSLPEYLLHNIERLMNASHENGAQLYKILCPELDKLIEIMHQADVYGGRVTGPFDSVSTPFSLMLTCSYSFRRRLGELHDLSRCRAPRDGVHSGSHSGQHLPELGEEELKKIGFVTKSSYGAFGTLVETPSLSKMDSDGVVIV